MKNFAIAIGAAGALAAAALGLAGAAVAAPSGLGSASDIVKGLEQQGYTVMVNGNRSAPLSECGVTAIHNPARSEWTPASGRVTQFTTVFVDISCPSNNT
jgi:hypothetical protein